METERENREQRHHQPHHDTGSRVDLGVILLFFGFLLLGRNLHFLPPRLYVHIFSWEVILMIVGFFLLFTRNNKALGLIFLLVGAVFLALNRFHLPVDASDLFWPVVLLGLGLLVLLRTAGSRWTGINRNFAAGDFLDEVSILGGNQKVITSQNFKGGRVTSLFGGSKIDMHQAKLAPGTNVLDVVTLFGSVKLTVPRDWEVQTEVVSILGGFTDKRIPDPHIIKEPGKVLIIKGVTMLGGGEILEG